MAFVLARDITDYEPATHLAAFQKYRRYLESVRDRMPPNAFEFAFAPWHFDSDDHRCPHDTWVESLTIKENASGSRSQYRNIQIDLRLLGAFHDGHLELSYKEVKKYELITPSEFEMPPYNVGHGDWLADEVRLSDEGLVIHEIEFARGSRWLIECRDITFKWCPKP
jgi:hypothetical protein